MAISKAMSGGPIYLSDEPGEFDPRHVRPLCFDDGRLLRPVAPGAPLPDSIYRTPFTEPRPYRTVAPLPNGAAAVAVFNLTHPGVTVRGIVKPEDHRNAAGLLEPTHDWPEAADGLVLYDWQTGEARAFDAEETFDLEELGCRLYHLLPIRHGWAVVGRPDKFLSPAGVDVVFTAANELVLRAAEAGPILLWSRRPFLAPDGVTVEQTADATWRLTVPAHLADAPLRLRR